MTNIDILNVIAVISGACLTISLMFTVMTLRLIEKMRRDIRQIRTEQEEFLAIRRLKMATISRMFGVPYHVLSDLDKK